MAFATTTKALAVTAGAALLYAGSTVAAPVAYYSDSGFGPMTQQNAEAWGGVNNSTKSVALEVNIDFTADVDSETAPVIVWECGGSGKGSALVIDGDSIHYFAGGANTHVASGLHGLSAGATDVQIVTAYEIGGGTGTNELLSVYINGALVASADIEAANDWTGGESGSALGEESGTQRYSGTALFNPAAVVPYPTAGADISFNAYLLASSGGNVDNTIENIVIVPEPGSLALLGLGGLIAVRRRRS